MCLVRLLAWLRLEAVLAFPPGFLYTCYFLCNGALSISSCIILFTITSVYGIMYLLWTELTILAYHQNIEL